MGEYADMLIDGLLDEETGELIDGDAPGYPRSPSRDRRRRLTTKQQMFEQAKRKPHKCTACGKRFKTQQGLGDHKRDAHERKHNG